MITNDLANSAPMPQDGIVFFDTFTVAPKPVVTADKLISSMSTCGCDCGCDSCNFVNYVYAETALTNELKNDKLLVEGIALSNASYVNFFIEKEIDSVWTQKVAISDSTYGTWTEVGDYASQLKLSTLYLKWREVLLAWGEGNYRVKIVTAALGGGTTTDYSEEYYLRFYTAERAEGSVVFNWFQDGKIFNNQINYTGLNIEKWIRVPGMIHYENPELIIDEIETSAHTFTQIQDKLEENYSFESHLLDFYTTQKILKDVFFGNEIYVTDFNYFNHTAVTEMLLKPISLNEVKTYPFNTCAKIKAGLKPKTRDNIKRNYF